MWEQFVQSLYPDLFKKTICVPPVCFQRVPYTQKSVARQSVFVLGQPAGAPTPNTTVTSSQSAVPVQTPNTTVTSSQSAVPVQAPNTTVTSSQSAVPVQTPNTTVTSSQSAVSVQTFTPGSSSSSASCPVNTTSSQCTASLQFPSPGKHVTSSQTASCQSTVSQQTTAFANQLASAIQAITFAASGTGVQKTGHGQRSAQVQNVGLAQLSKMATSLCSAVMSSQSQATTPSAAVGQASSQLQCPQSQCSLWPKIPKKQTALDTVFDSDIRDDFAQHHVLTNLQELGNHLNEVMFIISQLNFGDYLKRSSYAAAAAQKLPRPANLGKKYSQGDFDFLIIHRYYGILIGELKSIGRLHAALHKTPAEADADVAKRILKAVKQLNKSETVVKQLVCDILPGIMVKKSIFLPYVTSAQLRRVLAADPQLEKEVCQSLGATDAAEASTLCLCSEQLSDPVTYWDVTSAVLTQLTTWWQHTMTCSVENRLDDSKYLRIVARFAGPATSVHVHCSVPPRVEVRTLGQAVSELGNRLAMLVLTPQQLDLMTRAPPRVWLTGPPGTGKTIVLILMGLKWLMEGRDVHVASTYVGNQAVTLLIYHQIKMTLSSMGLSPSSPPVGGLYTHHFHFEKRPTDIMHAMATVTFFTSKGKQELALIIDEAFFTEKEARQYKVYEGLINSVLTTAISKNPYVWVASVHNVYDPSVNLPVGMQKEKLTVPLRSAPTVVREIRPGIDTNRASLPYSESHYNGIASPADGVKVIRSSHYGSGHQGTEPVDCRQCGLDVARILDQLYVGKAGCIKMQNSPNPLNYKDVFVLTFSESLQDDVINTVGEITSSASGVVQGLRSKHGYSSMCTWIAATRPHHLGERSGGHKYFKV